MKKIIAAAVGLALVGTMAVTATAAEDEEGVRPQLTLKGDARIRMGLNRDSIFGAETNDFLDSRVRVQAKYKAKGGAYAIVRMRMGDGQWDGTANTGNYGEATNFKIDKAYLGLPIGPVEIVGGYMPVSVTTFTFFDQRADRLSVNYKNEGTTLSAFYDKNQERTGSYIVDYIDDEDQNTYGLQLDQKLGADWNLTALAAYADDETNADISGFIGSISGVGTAGPVGIEADFMYVEEGGVTWGDTTSNMDDDAFGGGLSVSTDMGAIALKGTVGFTDGGFKVDQDYGYIMIGGFEPINNITNIGNGGDTIFGAVTAGFKVSDNTTLTGYVVYLDIDDNPALESALEVSGKVTYVVSEGASLTAGLGLLDASSGYPYDDPDTAFGAFGSMDIEF